MSCPTCGQSPKDVRRRHHRDMGILGAFGGAATGLFAGGPMGVIVGALVGYLLVDMADEHHNAIR